MRLFSKRILFITGFTKRDIGTCYLLAKLLEKDNCVCRITTASRAGRVHFRSWKPDAIFIMRVSDIYRLKSIYNYSSIFYCPGEGGEQYEFAEEKGFVKDKDLLDRVNMIFLWGEKSMRHIQKQQSELDANKKNSSLNDENMQKFKISGHPRMDTAQFYKGRKAKEKGRIKIGLIGSFSVINHASCQSTLVKILNGKEGLKNTEFQIRILNTYKKLIIKLNTDNYIFSLRPYIAESIHQYEETKLFNSGKLKIDQSIDFNSWVAEQDIIIGSTSSTIPQLVMSNKKYILVDFVDNAPNYSSYRKSLSKIFHENLPNILPKSFDELLFMIKNYELLETTTDRLNNILEDVYHCSPASVDNLEREPAIMMIYRNISKHVNYSSNNGRKNIYLPVFIVDLIDRYIVQADNNSYNDFSYSQLTSKLESEFKPIVTQLQYLRDVKLSQINN